MTDAAEAGMVHLRLIAGAEEAPRVLRVLENSPAVASLVRSPDRRSGRRAIASSAMSRARR